jgi:hypothetical protein
MTGGPGVPEGSDLRGPAPSVGLAGPPQLGLQLETGNSKLVPMRILYDHQLFSLQDVGAGGA